MIRTMLVALLATGLLAMPGVRAQPAAVQTVASSAEIIVNIIQMERVSYEKDLQTTPFKEVLEDVAKRYNITFVVNTSAFGDKANSIGIAKAEKLSVTKIDGMLLTTFFDVYFRALSVENVTYLVRADHIEITTRDAAQKEAGLMEAMDEAKALGEPSEVIRAKARLSLPLVCVAVKDRPLSAVLNDLSNVYGLNIVVEPGGGGAREILKTPLTERLLNVPVDTALELLAGQAGLNVVRRGNTFRITSNGPGAQ